MIFTALAGAVIVAIVLWEAFETVVLPRRVTRRWRLTRAYYRATWLPWRGVARRINSLKQRETFLSIFGPLSLLALFMLWAALLICGFGLLYYGASAGAAASRALQTCLYLSGTTFFTLGLGDVTPQSSFERAMAVVESGLGFGFLALVLSYLPVIYQAFSRRETNIVLLDARAGSPPTAGELLRRHASDVGIAELKQLLRDWERWSAEILESHVSYPVVSYFRSQHNNESWLAAIAAILDTSALLVASFDNPCARQARLTFAMCRHTVVDLAQVFHSPPEHAPADRFPSADLERLRASLAEVGMRILEPPDADRKLTKLRGMYEPYLQALATFLAVDLPPWILAKEITDNWRTSAWGRISGFAAPKQRDSELDDHG